MVTRETLNGNGFVHSYITAFQEIKCDIEQALPALHFPSEIAAKLLNALLFIEFISSFTTGRCRVLHQAWKIYKSLDHAGDDSFWKIILSPLLEIVAFGNLGQIVGYSPDIQQLFNSMRVVAPGLLETNELYELSLQLSDKTMGVILDHLATFNFALNNENIENSSMLITPGMLDDASEALACFLQGDDKMASRGIFYTSPAEIELICKTALLEYLHAETGISRRSLCEELLYLEMKEPEDGKNFNACEDLTILHASMEKIRVLDPACGSGAFLIGICKVCYSITKHVKMLQNDSFDFHPFFEEFVTFALHGVDTDAQAVQLARMRLWFWLLGNLKTYGESTGMIVLPDLSNNIVVGDFMRWDGSSRGKFHVIIGNPPYIRQEDIKPPGGICQSVTRVEKNVYKESIIDALKSGFPPVTKINKMSDFYVYFFFKGVQLLHDGGILCFITSNSWLDANFGKELQSYLLNHTSIIAAIDFAARSFDNADINTTITLCRRFDENNSKTDHTENKRDLKTKFVHFKRSSSEVSIMDLTDIIEADLDNGSDVQLELLPGHFLDDLAFRVFSINREDLMYGEPGENSPAKPAREKTIYFGNKWRVKYLNASELFYTILKKGQGLFVDLGSLADVKAGCYSGINDFFYLSEETIHDYGIEPDFYRPLLRNSEDVFTLAVNDVLDHFVLAIPPLSKSRLLEQGFGGVVSYIEWGEQQKTTRGQKTRAGISWPLVESVRSRPFWYSLSKKNLEPASQFMQYIAHDRFFCPWSNVPIVSDRSFHRIFPRDGVNARALHAVLNSTIQAFLVMSTGRSSLGGGALKIEAADAKDMLAIDVRKLTSSITTGLLDKVANMDIREPKSLFIETGLDHNQPFNFQRSYPLDDRLELDSIVFDFLGLDDEERNAIYKATCDAINVRLQKAKTRKVSTNYV